SSSIFSKRAFSARSRASSAAIVVAISVTPTPYATRSHMAHDRAPSGSRAHVQVSFRQRARSWHQGAETRPTLHQYSQIPGTDDFLPRFLPKTGHTADWRCRIS